MVRRNELANPERGEVLNVMSTAADAVFPLLYEFRGLTSLAPEIGSPVAAARSAR
jgi:hypothetical protein